MRRRWIKPGSAAIFCAALGGCGAFNVEQRAQTYHAQEAHRRVADYEQARARGDLLSMCVKANLVSAAYQDAKDVGNARAWDSRREADCKTALATLAPDLRPPDR